MNNNQYCYLKKARSTRIIGALAISSLLLVVTGCDSTIKETNPNAQPNTMRNESTNNNHTKNEAPMRNQPTVYVTAFDVDSNAGNAAAAHGVLNTKNGCLYMDDLLLVVSSPHITWTQDPFTISNFGKGGFKVGDTVFIGGSQADYKNLASFSVDWKNPPLATCKAEKIWLMNSISTPI